MYKEVSCCRNCPRRCSAKRNAEQVGYCGMTKEIYISRCAPHLWEEPPISGMKGSGTVFFTGCNLRCVFCQNAVISRDHKGEIVTGEELCRNILSLADEGVHNINLVTPTHYTEQLIPVLKKVKPHLDIPIVWNSSGYESVEALRGLEGLVDIYLPDFKYMSDELSSAYSSAPDYAQTATHAVLEMYRQVGKPIFNSNGLMKRGMIIRHLVLPGCRKDSIAILHHLADILPPDGFKLSLMRQYTPEFALHTPYKNLHRKVTDFEYTSVLEEAVSLGLDGYSQGKDSATAQFTPSF
ncbi:MAG: 4Fe-4S cluster-binding domain-containing protein [Ruminococcaceae bacterium]|nr:4Fe-4S cluster-binding domain-containing protein [Oscillospiraceae bacterium]